MNGTQAQTHRHTLGVVVTLLNALVVLGVVGGLLWLEEPGRPNIRQVAARVDAAAVSREGTALVVPFELHNLGDHTVDEVVVEISIGPDDALRTQQVITHLPRGSSRRGVAIFPDAPADVAPTAVIRGYQEP